jgi:hypothetical protein
MIWIRKVKSDIQASLKLSLGVKNDDFNMKVRQDAALAGKTAFRRHEKPRSRRGSRHESACRRFTG